MEKVHYCIFAMNRTDPAKHSRGLRWAESFARLLDSKFSLPGTKFRFGIDPILGLVPGLGDGISLVMQLLLASSLLKHGFSGELAARLFINVLLDTLIGSIPVVGQIFDFFFKASQRNLRLTKEYLYEGKHQGKGYGLWLALLLILILTIALVVYLVVLLVNWLVDLF